MLLLSGCGGTADTPAATVTTTATVTQTIAGPTVTATETVTVEPEASDADVAGLSMSASWGSLSEDEQFETCLDYHWDNEQFIESMDTEIGDSIDVTEEELAAFFEEVCD